MSAAVLLLLARFIILRVRAPRRLNRSPAIAALFVNSATSVSACKMVSEFALHRSKSFS
jgi:hypothetical protein